jgi:myo-inositol-1-phosphate synthase
VGTDPARGPGSGDVPLDVELEAHDSPNSAGIVIDAVGRCKLALDHGLSGSPEGPSACFMRPPARHYTDNDARRLTEEFISTYGRGSAEPSKRHTAAAQD